jgi:PDZ domain-containing protein
MLRNFSTLPRTAVAILALFFGSALVAPLPYVLIKPGNAQNIMEETIKVSETASPGVAFYPSDGEFLLLSILVTSPGSHVIGPEVIYSWVRGENVVIPRSLVYKPGNSPQEEKELATAAMTDSQRDAKIAAVRYLIKNYPSQISPSFSIDDIAISKTNTGGPSGGMIYALGVIELFTAENFLNGRIVAGTGTIDAKGIVGPIGGVNEKIIAAKRAGATLFLLPSANCKDLENVPEGISVAAVSSLDTAISALNSATPRGCASVGA